MEQCFSLTTNQLQLLAEQHTDGVSEDESCISVPNPSSLSFTRLVRNETNNFFEEPAGKIPTYFLPYLLICTERIQITNVCTGYNASKAKEE